MQDDISVIIPTYNRAGFLLEAIQAIQAQTRSVREIIVVDDGSSDHSREVVQNLKGPISYLYQPNAGKSVALNSGLRRATGDYIWICDDDDLALPHAAELLTKALHANADAALAFGQFKRFAVNASNGKRQLLPPTYWPDLSSTSILVALLLDCFIFQNACLIRKRALDAAGPFRPELLRSQDYEMTVRLIYRFEAAYVPEVVFLQRTHEGFRGAEADRFDSARLVQKWLQYDAMFFREIYETIPLTKFAPKNVADASRGVSERSALLQRACIFWRRKLFDLSLGDLTKAIKLGNGDEITPVEKRICEDFLHAKFGCDELISRSTLADALSTLASQNSFGQSVIQTMTSPLLWYIRRSLIKHSWRRARDLSELLLKLHGFSGTTSLILDKIAQRL
jgi:glycosyltransferase involved in cell wall biosynthesis